MYPARLRGRIVGIDRDGPRRGRRARGASPAASSPTGWVGRPRSRSPARSGRSARSPTPGSTRRPPAHPPVFSARDSIRALRERPVLARVALAQGFYGGGFIAAAPLFAIVYVDRLDLSLADVGVIGILTAASTTVSFLAWGVVSDRYGPLVGDARRDRARPRGARRRTPSPRRSASCGSPRSRIGAASSSIDVGIAAVVSEHTPLASRSRRDGRLERDHRRARDRGRVPHERAAPGGPRRRDDRPAPVRRVHRRSASPCTSAPDTQRAGARCRPGRGRRPGRLGRPSATDRKPRRQALAGSSPSSRRRAGTARAHRPRTRSIPGARLGTMPTMRLTPWEEERLLIFTAAELARRHRAAGILAERARGDRPDLRCHARGGAGRRVVRGGRGGRACAPSRPTR